MRIGLVIYGSIDALTGGYLYDKHMAAHLTSRGHEVRIVALPVRGYPLRWIDNVDHALLARIAGAGYHVLIQDELCHPSLVLLNRRLRRRSAMPVVALVHHVLCREPRRPAANAALAWPEKRYLDGVDGFIFNSRTTRDTVFSLSPGPRPFVVAPPGGDRFNNRLGEPEIESRARRPGPLRLLFLGLAIPRKGLLPLVEALGQVPRTRWRLEVIGDTTMAPDYVRQVHRLMAQRGLEDNIVFRGTLGTAALAQTMARSQLLCMPFAYEGFGIATLEALQCGMPVLGCTEGATSELIRHGYNGLLFRRCDRHGVAAAVQMLQADRGQLARMSIAALQRATEHPTWQNSMQQIDAFLAALCAGRAHPSPAGRLPEPQTP